MRRLLAAMSLATLLTAPALAAGPQDWPWNSTMPPDPALAILSKVSEVTASVDGSEVKIGVKALAPVPGFSELQLTPRMGDPEDRIFAFDARGRAPQDVSTQVETQVSIEAAYTGAPIGKFDMIEVHAKDNCLGYSVTDKKPMECSAKSIPQ